MQGRPCAEAVIREAAELFADLGAPVEVRNQARVHLWFPAHHGLSRPPIGSAREGDRFESGRAVIYVIVDDPDALHERAKAAGFSEVVFDRGGNRYAGRVAAIADGAREGGLAL